MQSQDGFKHEVRSDVRYGEHQTMTSIFHFGQYNTSMQVVGLERIIHLIIQICYLTTYHPIN